MMAGKAWDLTFKLSKEVAWGQVLHCGHKTSQAPWNPTFKPKAHEKPPSPVCTHKYPDIWMS